MNEPDKSKKFYTKPIFVNSVLLVVNLGLFIFKLIFADLSGSLALQADAFDNLTDIIMVFAALVGITYAKRKPNEKFPYGYYKIENIISLIISLIIFYTAYNVILISFSEIYAHFVGLPKQIITFPITLKYKVVENEIINNRFYRRFIRRKFFRFNN